MQAMGRERKRRVVVWDEVWDLLGKDAHPQTVVQLWRPWGGSNRTRQARAPPRAPLAACVPPNACAADLSRVRMPRHISGACHPPNRPSQTCPTPVLPSVGPNGVLCNAHESVVSLVEANTGPPPSRGDMRAGVADQAGLAREQIAKAGHSMIWMQDGPWYLDDVEATWADMASVEVSLPPSLPLPVSPHLSPPGLSLLLSPSLAHTLSPSLLAIPVSPPLALSFGDIF